MMRTEMGCFPRILRRAITCGTGPVENPDAGPAVYTPASAGLKSVAERVLKERIVAFVTKDIDANVGSFQYVRSN